MAKSIRKIYLDYASSALSKSANSGAVHELGVKEKNKLEQARADIAKLLNSHKNEVVFTSGATESNNLAILGIKSGEVVTTNIEHASVLETCKHRQATFVPVESDGVVDPEKIKKVLNKNTVLVSVMYANNEIGTIQPIREIAKEIRHFNKLNNTKIFFHIDATQAVNYLPVNVEKLGVDLMSFNAAKIYGPKGVGALYVRRGTPVSKIMFGGDQENGLRPGTENVAGAVALALALENVEKIKEKESIRLTKLRDYFFLKLEKMSKDIFNSELLVNGDRKNRLPNNVNITIPNIPSDLLVIELSARGIMASAKSACKSGDGKASHVIQAINPNTKDTDGYLRFSLGRETSKKDIDHTIVALVQILKKLKKWYD
ncbi:MAG: cysteine desulfurase [Candidatus Pacebacteria bacterium]|nr:cysteine desulfurase [Candidatus Paceibacterota bacterium]